MIVLVCLESPIPGPAAREALHLAARLRGHARIFSLTVDGPKACESLAVARQHDAVERAYHLADPTLDKADFFTLGMVIAETARHLEARLILMGQLAHGEGQGLVPAAVAHHLRAPLIARIRAVRCSANAPDTVEVDTRANGRMVTVVSPLPLVLAAPPVTPIVGVPGENRESRQEELVTLSLGQIGVDASRMVPRPDLLGKLVPAPAPRIETRSVVEIAKMIREP